MLNLIAKTRFTHPAASEEVQQGRAFATNKPSMMNHTYKDILTHQYLLETALINQDALSLVHCLTESLHRFLNEINDSTPPDKHDPERKLVKQSYLNTVFKCFDYLQNTPSMPLTDKLKLLSNAQNNLGAPALMLSGGGTFGIYHLGVIKTLLEQNLLPAIISGSSMGSIAAGILATHTNDELTQLFLEPHKRDYAPLKWLSFKHAMQESCLLDSQRLYDCIHSNIGNMTFSEAFEHTGRTVSITVSPTRPGQKPRILNHLTSPNVLIAHASKASCSIPGLFPPVQLQQRIHGNIIPYCQDEKWIDGSFATDIPRQRISRLFNVNFFIVSQANPHILPFVQNKQETGWLSIIKDLAVDSMHAQSRAFLSVLSRRNNHALLRPYVNQLTSMIDQDYQGDINIHPDFPLKWFSKIMINPTPSELDFLIKMGEESTFKKIELIKNQTQIYLKITEIMRTLQNRHSETAVV